MLDNRLKSCAVKTSQKQWWASFKCIGKVQRKTRQAGVTPLYIILFYRYKRMKILQVSVVDTEHVYMYILWSKLSAWYASSITHE